MHTPAVAVQYTVSLKSPEQHLFHVQLQITQPDHLGQKLFMPAWIPGSYLIRDFARNIVSIEACSNQRKVALHKLDKDTWQCDPCDGVLLIDYDVYAWDLSVRGAHLDTTHGYFNGTCLFLAVVGQEQHPCHVELQKPKGENYQAWRVATTLPADTAKPYGFGRYRAADYDELVDHPVEMGNFTLATFEAGGIPHDIVLTGKHQADMERLCADLKPICEEHIKLFGELPVNGRYLFLTLVVGSGYGGLEHRSSTSLICSRDSLPVRHKAKASDEYLAFLGLCSHEYFHTWNVKRIKPAAFMPYDLSRETHTRQLWAFEGITSYYDDLGMVRSGSIDLKTYLKLFAEIGTRVYRMNGRTKQSVAESSFDAWTKFYKQDENAPNAIISYYTKGALIACALDLSIRRQTQARQSLDDVMQRLWQEYGRKNIGVPEGQIEKIASEVAGENLSAFFADYLYGTKDLPLETLFAEMGIQLKFRAAESSSDKGGTPPSNGKTPAPWFGINSTAAEGGVKFTNVLDNGPAQKAGVSAEDIGIALNGLKIEKGNFEKILGSYQVGDTVTLHAFRRDELMEFKVTLAEPPNTTCYFVIDETASEEQLERRAQWLHQH
ncbi:MAG: PDZ domain-containing protein [Gammaproteobacteria bacterium]